MRLLFLLTLPFLCSAQQWSNPVEVVAGDDVCATYDAALAGDVLTVRLRLAKGWHSFAMDNTVRAQEKLAGRKALAFDRPTSVLVSGGWETAGPWRQSEPKDFSKPDLRIYSWGFEGETFFQAPVRPLAAGGPAKLAVKAQACTETICRNIDVTLEAAPAAGGAVSLSGLIPVRGPGSI